MKRHAVLLLIVLLLAGCASRNNDVTISGVNNNAPGDEGSPQQRQSAPPGYISTDTAERYVYRNVYCFAALTPVDNKVTDSL